MLDFISGFSGQIPGGPVAASQGFNLTSLPGLGVWYKADAGVFQDTGGVTPCAATNDPVGLIRDQSGAGNDASNGATTKPKFQSGALNSLPTVLFDGSTQFLTLNSSVVLGSTWTVYCVGKRATAGAIWNPIDGNKAFLGWYLAAGYFLNDDTGATGATNGFTGPSGNIIMRTRLPIAAGLVYLACTGAADSALTGSPTGTFTLTQLMKQTFNGFYGNGSIAEFAVWPNRCLNAGELTQVDNYLTTKWGVSY